MNEAKLRDAIGIIKQEPLRLDMSVYYCEADERVDRDLYPVSPPCNTVMCIAGAVISREAWLLGISYEDLVKWKVESDVASELLELDEKTAKKLFFVENWPIEFADHYDELTENLIGEANPDIARQIAADRFDVLEKRVEHFITTSQ